MCPFCSLSSTLISTDIFHSYEKCDAFQIFNIISFNTPSSVLSYVVITILNKCVMMQVLHICRVEFL